MVRFIDAGDEPADVDTASGGPVAPVIPLFERRGTQHEASTAPTRAEDRRRPLAGGARRARERDETERDETDRDEPDRDEAAREGAERDAAERTLLRKLRVRSLSVREARSVLGEQGLPTDEVDDVLQTFLDRGYLDDAALAEQLTHAAVDRKGHGRRVIAQTLAKRGVPRDVADAALEALPDDDAERALEFARSKARSMASLDGDTALRRLMGQLARRGYGGSAAMSAAKQALAEYDEPRRVRFD
ncbi:regulatory protein RecX [Microbacterium sp. Marseille-Q6648]|uniref:regulatory protein RecX n=1 Tax=Microbacterium sp. Marseille-Q6648 TaxID=2937991 RepID=UPI00203D6723|nr:regulatory protein RecX [Microbacterium sp. Marseille-Q6648]